MGNFYTDVIRKAQEFSSTGRISTLDLLEPETRTRVKALMVDAKNQGIELMAYETFRSNARQKVLFDRGATKLRTVGVHNYGLACDIVKVVNGQPSWDGSFAFLATLAKTHGLISGIDWGNPNIKHTFVDSVHVQRCSIAMQNGLFSGLWYPDSAYDPYA